jgi:hypothetical protein
MKWKAVGVAAAVVIAFTITISVSLVWFSYSSGLNKLYHYMSLKQLCEGI